jgi:DNA-binding NarL/FixJ family response regulator
MKLCFSILWFDDNEDYFKSAEDDIKELEYAIANWGFTPKIITISKSEEFTSHHPYKEFDLIVVDHNLYQGKNGSDFINSIRNNQIFTEIILYTSLNTDALWKALFENRIEGVYISNRENIFGKIKSIGYQSIRKILDLENMRGIVMAEVGDLDHLLEQIIIKGFETLEEESQMNLLQRFSRKLQEDHKSCEQKITDFIASPDANGMLHFCDSNKKWENFNRLCKIHKQIKKPDEINDYVQEILLPRNFLAHGSARLDDNGDYYFSFNGSEFQFNETVSISLRKHIMKYKNAFQEICNEISK